MSRAGFSIAIVSVVLCCGGAFGAPVFGEVFRLRQPDGSLVEAKIWGDEFYQVIESLDGYTLVRDPETGVIAYAELSSDGAQLVSTGLRVQRGSREDRPLKRHIRINPESATSKAAAARAKHADKLRKNWSRIQEETDNGKPGSGSQTAVAATSSSGNVRGICILIDFPDEAGVYPPSEIERFCNKIGYDHYGNNGSIRDYFHDVSDGRLTYTNFVPDFYYTAKHEKAYYDDPRECGTESYHRAQELLREALEYLNRTGFDFRPFDANGDGVIDAVNALYVGKTTSGWNCGLWPHASSIFFRADGVQTHRYQITGIGDTPSIGVFCHENGHLLCSWPDLYDYDFDSEGVGAFCLMAHGTFWKNPAEPCAFLKARAGWAEVRLLTVPQACSLTAGVNTIYKILSPSQAGEYFLIENRLKFARDARLPDSGLAIWHIDQANGDQRNQQRTATEHFLVTLVQADGNWELERGRNRGDTYDLWSYPDFPEWGPSTIPSSSWWNGLTSGVQVSSIGPAREVMTFSFFDEPFLESLNINKQENFPDPNFRRVVEEFMNTVPGGFFTAEQVSEASWRQGDLRCDNRNIRDLTGFEYLNGLTALDCSHNQLTNLDVANNPMLRSIRCRGNRLANLDISGATALREIRCQDNPLMSINLSGCVSLTVFEFTGTVLQTLDVSDCSALAELDCSHNALSELDVTGCVSLKWLWCSQNRLESLDLTENVELSLLSCSGNRLERLDVSECPALRSIDCRDNRLMGIESFADCPSLVAADVRGNRLACDDWLDVLDLSERLGQAFFRGDTLTSGFAYSPQQGQNPFDCASLPATTPTPTLIPLPTPTSTPPVTNVDAWRLITP